MSSEAVAAPRYRRLDEYTALEVRTRYEASHREARIELLQSVFDAGGQLPHALALAAASDPDASFRAWFARNARDIDYTYDVTVPREDANLWKTLRGDPDHVVRLAVLENPQFDEFRYMQPTPRDFATLSHVERLAVLRNPRLASNGVPDVVLSIFDTADTSLIADAQQRAELALAYLTNEAAVRQSHDFDYPREIRYDPVSYTFEKERERLWRLAAAFPDSTVRWYAFRHLGAKDEWKAATYEELRPLADEEFSYENSQRATSRYAILWGCGESDIKTLSLGVKDRDEDCYELARRKFAGVEQKRSKFWRVAGHLWVVAQNLLVLGVIIAVLSSAETKFEKVVIAAIVYLFVTLTAFTLQVFATYRATVGPLDAQFEGIRKLLGEKRPVREREVIAQQKEEIRWEFAKANVNHVITSIALFLAWLITLVALVGALLD